jgi:hypothetical protein
LDKEIRVGEKGDLIPPICLVHTPTSYVFGKPPTQALTHQLWHCSPERSPFPEMPCWLVIGKTLGGGEDKEGEGHGGKEKGRDVLRRV